MGVSPHILNQDKEKIETIASKAEFFLNTFWKIVPKEFLTEYKNPCFYSSMNTRHVGHLKMSEALSERNRDHNKQRLYCLPYFLLPGFPKSETTSLHSVLSKHTQIIPPEDKEPQWWYKPPLNNERDLDVFITKYLSAFVTASTEVKKKKDGASFVTYDASQTMMTNGFDSSFHINHEDYCALPAVISRVLPHAKIIVLMRDPVLRSYSHYLYMYDIPKYWPKEMRKNPDQYFNKYIQDAVTDFRHCYNQNGSSIYECTNSIRSNFNELKMRIGTGIYHIFIKKWMQFWPRENFLLLKMEEMDKKPVASMDRITDFLSLDSFSSINATKWLKDRKNVSNVTTRMLPETQHLLESFYKPFNKMLDDQFGITWSYSKEKE